MTCHSTARSRRRRRASLRSNRPAAVLLAGGLLLLAGCGFDGAVTQVQLPTGGPADVTLTLRSDSLPEAAALLGWGDALPDVEVTIAPLDEELAEPRTERTDAAGSVEFLDMEGGHEYRVSVQRILTAEEFEAVRETGVTGLADAFVLRVDGPEAEFELAPRPARRGSLVISEFFPTFFFRVGVGSYRAHQYISLYNNGDTTIYLDGMILGEAFSPVGLLQFCGDHLPFRADPEGLWANRLQQFPGSGTDHPLLPGQTVVVANTAIDHSALIEELPDLSGADFEFQGTTGAENPAVPNMIERSLNVNPLGIGLVFDQGTTAPFIAEALVVEDLPQVRDLHFSSSGLLRIPAEAVLELAEFRRVTDFSEWCGPSNLHDRFNRLPSYLLQTDLELSLHRSVAFTLPDGRGVFQHTGSSQVDFFLAPRTLP